jgi:TonB family protein
MHRDEVTMLDVLIASRPSRLLRPEKVGSSLACHGLLLLLAIAATSAKVERPQVVVADTTLLFLPRLAPPPALPAEASRRLAGVPGRGGAGASLVVAINPPPRGFQTVVAPGSVPTSIPPVDLDQHPFDPRDFTGRGVEGGVAYGVVGGTGDVDPDLAPTDGDVVYTATLEDVQFEPARLISEPQPRYPPVLQQAGVSGFVKLRFIVDTTGRVERPSIKVLESSHDAFEESARETVAQAVFHPARLGQRPVRQWAQQPIRFIAVQ